MRLISRNSHTLALDLFEYLGGGQHLVVPLVAVGAEHGSLSPLCGLVAWCWFVWLAPCRRSPYLWLQHRRVLAVSATPVWVNWVTVQVGRGVFACSGGGGVAGLLGVSLWVCCLLVGYLFCGVGAGL